MWLKANNLLYRDIKINEDVLTRVRTQMESVSETDMVGQLSNEYRREESQGEEHGEGSEVELDSPDQGNNLAVGEDDDGAHRLERVVQSNPIQSNQTTTMAQGLRERLAEAPANHIPHNGNGATLNDYFTPCVQAMAFPTIFPCGTDGDVTFKNRSNAVTMTGANAHLLKYAIKPIDVGWRYPFAEHDRWMNWVQNTCERHRMNAQKKVYLEKYPDDANMGF